MRIEQVTRYRCNGCEREETNPTRWMTLVPMMVGSVTMAIGGAARGSVTTDYCPECLGNMRAALHEIWLAKKSA